MKEKLDEIDENTSAEEAAEIERKFDEMMADADRLTAKIEREERLNGAEDLLERTVERRSGNEDLEPENRADNNLAEITSEQQVAAFRSWADFHQVGFIAFMRLDGELSDTAAVKKMTML